MKYQLRLFVDNYETTVKNLKPQELKAIGACISEYIRQEKKQENFSFTIEMTEYSDPVAINVPDAFKSYTEKKIHLDPFGFNKKLDIEFNHISDSNFVCRPCNNIWCEGHCGVLDCGCIDLCRGRCDMGIDSY